MRRLQTFNFKKSFYERPNQNWICGRACLGEPCLAGPDRKGNCQTTCECRPLKKGGRWHCTRPTSQGGPCAAGPLPNGQCCRPLPKCQPVRSLRAWRGLAIIVVVAATLSALILVLTTKVGQAILSPGELSFQHSSYKSQCSDCHLNVKSDARPIAWFHSSEASGNESGNSQLCLKCHNLGPQSFAAHALPRDRLEGLTQRELQDKSSGSLFSMEPNDMRRTQNDSLSPSEGERVRVSGGRNVPAATNGLGDKRVPLTPALSPAAGGEGETSTKNQGSGAKPLPLRLSSMLGGNPKNREAGLACATCHVEHQGKRHDLTRLSDLQCQSCHAVQFASFSDGHPPFKDYPFRRRTRIIFDHRSHLQEHFKDKQFGDIAPTSCSACHGPDPKGSAMVVKSFDQTCAACHLDQIKGKGRVGPPGLAVIRLPGLDVQSLIARGIVIGDWPEEADGTITPFMELLLASQSRTNAARPRVAGGNFLDLSKANDAALNEAADLAWSVKEFFYDLSTKGHAGLEERLKFALKGQLSTSQTEAVAGLLSADVIQAARAKWFPNLAAEIAQHRAGKKLAPPAITNSPPATDEGQVKPEEWVVRGGWYRSDPDYSISYRPRGHADSFLQSWLDLTVGAPAAQKLFDSLSDSKAPGLCMKCHSVDALPQPHANWPTYQPDAFEHRFTHFSHVAHFSLLDDKGCQTCHTLDASAARESYAAAFDKAQSDPTVFHSNFKSIDLALCASCHTRKYAGESCLKCHNYHIGHFVPTLPREQWGTPPTNARR